MINLSGIFTFVKSEMINTKPFIIIDDVVDKTLARNIGCLCYTAVF